MNVIWLMAAALGSAAAGLIIWHGAHPKLRACVALCHGTCVFVLVTAAGPDAVTEWGSRAEVALCVLSALTIGLLATTALRLVPLCAQPEDPGDPPWWPDFERQFWAFAHAKQDA